MEINKVYEIECIQGMREIPDGSIDMIFCDLPYGTTRNRFDVAIDPENLWKQYERIIKPNGAILLFGQDKFTARMILSNERMHRYNIIWEKTTPTGFLNAKKMPLRTHEDIMVFYKSAPTYNPQKTSGHQRKVSKVEHHVAASKTGNYGEYRFEGYDSTERYPTSVWKFKTDRQKTALHPNQKPLELCNMQYARSQIRET